MNSVEILKELEKYEEELSKPIELLLFEGKVLEATEKLEKLESGNSIIESFKKEMKKKSFYKTLRKILKEDTPDRLDIVKTASSLLTHLVIEAKEGKQREVLQPYIIKVGRELNKILEETSSDIEFLKEFIA